MVDWKKEKPKPQQVGEYCRINDIRIGISPLGEEHRNLGFWEASCQICEMKYFKEDVMPSYRQALEFSALALEEAAAAVRKELERSDA